MKLIEVVMMAFVVVIIIIIVIITIYNSTITTANITAIIFFYINITVIVITIITTIAIIIFKATTITIIIPALPVTPHSRSVKLPSLRATSADFPEPEHSWRATMGTPVPTLPFLFPFLSSRPLGPINGSRGITRQPILLPLQSQRAVRQLPYCQGSEGRRGGGGVRGWEGMGKEGTEEGGGGDFYANIKRQKLFNNCALF